MRFNRLLIAGLLALLSVGTATASQLNSVQVTPKANTATVTLKTTGSFAHKEYRPDDHLMLVDLSGVTSNASLVHATPMNSAALKRYAVSTYTNASGTVVTRLELTLGDKVSADVVDASDGLRILLTASPATAAAPKPSAAAASPASKPAPAAAEAPTTKTASAPAAKPSPAQNTPNSVAKSSAPANPANAKPAPAAPEKQQSAATVTKVRSVSVEQEQNSFNITIAGPNSAAPYRLKNPDRLVLDFPNSVMQPSVKNLLAVKSKDVLQVRVGRPNTAPTMTRVVIDLRGPREFEVLPSAGQVVVRIKTEAAAPAKETAKPENASAAKAPEKPAAGTPEPAPEKTPAEVAAVAPVQKSEDKAIPAEPAKASVKEAAPAFGPPNAPANPPAAPQVASLKPVALRQEPVPANAVAASRALAAAALVSPKEQLAEDAAAASAATGKLKYTGEPISVNLKDVDLKDFFRLIHEISGLNVVLDPSVRGSVTLVLDDVPWDQALDIVLRNNALDRELQGNVLRIAAQDTLRREAVDRRAQAEAVALAVDRQTITRTLSYAKAGQAVPTIKKFLTQRGDVIADDRTNSLIISDIPSVLPSLDRLITQLDMKSQQVEIEVRVVSANRAFARDIGVQMGFLWGNGVSSVAGLPTQIGQTTLVDRTGGTVAKVPLFSNFPAANPTTGLGFANVTNSYALDVALTLAESRNLAKVLSRPRVVTQNNIKAEVKQGVKIPVPSPGTFTQGAATTAYVDAVLRLSVTPQITADNTIFLRVDVENTQPLSQDNPPRLSTQQANTEVLVSDGGTVMIGGVIQTTNQVTTKQTPLLGDIPWLGNLFKERAVLTETDELIFFITPKIQS